jgi:hypothetical protein
MNELLLKEAQGESGHRPLCEGMERNLVNHSASASLTPGPAIPKMEDPGPLCAAHTPNFPALLRRLGASLLVTTYQAGLPDGYSPHSLRFRKEQKEPGLTPHEPRCEAATERIFTFDVYVFFQRLLTSSSTPPAKSVIALMAEAGSISGTGGGWRSPF